MLSLTFIWIHPFFFRKADLLQNGKLALRVLATCGDLDAAEVTGPNLDVAAVEKDGHGA